MKKLSKEVSIVLDGGVEAVKELKHDKLAVDHIFLSLMKNNPILMSNITDLSYESMRGYVSMARQMNAYRSGIDQLEIESNLDSKTLLLIADNIAEEFNSEEIEVTHLLAALLQTDSDILNQIFKIAGIKKEDSLAKIIDMMLNTNPKEISSWKPLEKLPKALELCKDLTKDAYDGKIDPVIGRNEEIERIIQILCRRTKNNPVLIGAAGTGKTCCVEGLAEKIVRGDVPSKLKDMNILTLDIGNVVAGSKFRGR